MKPAPIKVAPLDAQRMVMSYLRMCNYVPQRTSEIARALNVQPSCIRRAGLYLASIGNLRAELVKGRGRGEYLFILEQLDLFDDSKPEKKTLWQRLKELVRG